MEIVELEKEANTGGQEPHWSEDYEQTLCYKIYHSNIPQHLIQLLVLQGHWEGSQRFEGETEGEWIKWVIVLAFEDVGFNYSDGFDWQPIQRYL